MWRTSMLLVPCFTLLLGPSSARPAEVASRVSLAARPFAPEQVRLLPGPFRQAMELDQKYLLALDPERLLHAFRLNAGLKSTATPLGGWEEPKVEVRGHFVGHYLTACARFHATTGDRRFKDRADLLVAELAHCQKALGGGYLSAFPETFIDRVETLKPVWAPWYTLHKLLAGLLDVHVHCHNAEALEVARRFGDWVQARSGRLSEQQMQAMLNNEHGGMNEALANLAAATGEEKYLRLSRRFNHDAVLLPASRRQDRLTGLHANTQIPKFIGAARQYELTGDETLRTAAAFFWDTVVHERSYVIGGHSDNEHFTPKEKLSEALGSNTAETCNTYNMLKLTRHLFGWAPKPEYADYYERATINHILASQNPADGMMCYYVPLRPGSRKLYNTPLHSFWCCTGTGVENHIRYVDAIYFHDGGQKLYWTQFIASELTWQDKGVIVRQETAFPTEGHSRLTFTCAKPVALSLHVRRPAWAGDGFTVTVNGKAEPVRSGPGSFVVVTRTWQDGDRVEVTLPMTLRTESFRDNPRRLAFLHGPLVLCAEVPPHRLIPGIVTDPGRLLASLKPVEGKASTFRAARELFRIPGEKTAADVTLEPFYRMHGSRHHVVYWDVFTPEQWQAREAEYRAEQARQRELDARTVDRVNPGEPQNERDHALQGEHTSSGDYGGRKWRHATAGGWFSYEVKVIPDAAQELRVSYWGSDVGRTFDILVDGKKLATQKLQSNRPDRFYDETYPLPAERLRGKQRLTVRFEGQKGSWAGGVFGVRVLRASAEK